MNRIEVKENVVDQVSDYGWNSLEEPHSLSYTIDSLLSCLKINNSKRVLDIGCGNGSYCRRIKESGYDIVGVDYDNNAIELARSGSHDIRFYKYGVQDDPRELIETEGFFDTVVSCDVIEHLYSPQLLCLFAKKVLQQNGNLIVATPYHGYLKNLALSVTNGWDRHHNSLWDGGHIKFWSFKSISRLLNENGFCVKGFTGVGRIPYLWKGMVVTARMC